MHAIEKQALLHLFTKELAVALLEDEEQAKKVFNSSFLTIVVCMCMMKGYVYLVI